MIDLNSLILHLKYDTPYTGDSYQDTIALLEDLADKRKNKPFQRFYLYTGEDFLVTELSEQGAIETAHKYLKTFQAYSEIKIITLDGYELVVRRED